MHTWRFTIEYAGTRFSGWQEQKNAVTVAGELRRALVSAGAVVGEIGGAGRTDAGVHALAQVAHVRLEGEHDPAALLSAVNDGLPADVNVLSVEPADARFHARHQASSRSYVYQIAARRTAFAKRYVWWVDEELDVSAMQRAASLFVGEHDFAAFCDRAKGERGTRVRVDRAQVGSAPALVIVRFEASHFLWRMVRRLVGALVQVGTGRSSIAEVRELLEAADEAAAARVRTWTAPASGLFLESVRYPGDPELAPLAPAFPIERPR